MITLLFNQIDKINSFNEAITKYCNTLESFTMNIDKDINISFKMILKKNHNTLKIIGVPEYGIHTIYIGINEKSFNSVKILCDILKNDFGYEELIKDLKYINKLLVNLIF